MVDVTAKGKQICLSTTTLRKIKHTHKQDTTVEGDDFSALCRTCANSATFMTPIFSGDGLENNLPDLINKYLPIKVSQSDELPQSLCYECAHTLLSWHELVSRCRRANLRFRKTAKQRKLRLATHKDDNKDYKWIKSSIELIVKEVLTDYTQIQDREQVCLQYVCQKCPDKSKSVVHLTGHIHDVHLPEINSETALKDFVRENITFEEILEEVGNESFESLEKEDKSLEKSDSEIMEDIEEDLSEEVFTDTIEHSEKQNETVNVEEAVTNSSKDTEPEVKSRAPSSFHCPFCSSMFSTMARLHHHMGQHPDINEEEGIVCCGRDYCSKTEYIVHYQERHASLRSKVTSEVCRACGFAAESNEELKTHIASSHGPRRGDGEPRRRRRAAAADRPRVRVSCPHCEKLLHKDSLRIHLKIHYEKERPVFACDKCDKKYTVKGNLTFHRRVAHEGLLRYACARCGELFAARASRDRHQRAHEPRAARPRPHACPAGCGATFADAPGARRHQRKVHVNRRPHACHRCSKRYHEPGPLRRHLLLKHGLDTD